jgi:radical SAM superfamily enzyme YgiQ (UPF0313 family)
MNILLINPRYDERQYRYRVNKLYAPLGISYIARVLEQGGHAVSILDMEAEELAWEELPARLHETEPVLVGVGGTTPISHCIERCVELVREHLPTSTIVVGGPHATLLPEEVLSSMPGADYILRGEAERTMRDLVSLIEAGMPVRTVDQIPGLGLRLDGKALISPQIPRTQDLDGLPPPAYHLLPLERYFTSGVNDRVFTLMTSRGCPFACTFCNVAGLYGRKFRGRSPRSVITEMRYLKEHHDIGHFVFYDATFNIDTERVRGISELLIQQEMGVTWRARMRAEGIDRSLLELMQRAGCIEVSIGVESGFQPILDGIRKESKPDQVARAFRLAREIDLHTTGYFIVGLPGDTHETMRATVERAIELDPDWALFSIATPMPGTPFFDMVRDQRVSEDWSDHKCNTKSPVVSYPDLSAEEIGDALDDAYRRFYIREDWLKGRMKRAKTSEERDNIVASFFGYLNRAVSLPDQIPVRYR